MSDLMKSETVNYKKLAENYNNFQVPAVRVKIGTAQYSTVTSKETKKGKMMLIHEMNAMLYHNEGSSVSILIDDVYELESSRFKEIVILGEKIQVEIGYGSKFHQIFVGYVGEIQYQFFGNNQYIRITGFDTIALMTQNYKSRCYSKKKYSDVISEIVGNYNNILSVGKIDASGEQPQPVLSCRDINDYDYICDVLCPHAGKEFYIFNGKAYFQAVNDRCQTPSVTFKLGRGLFDFQITSAYANLEINVNGLAGMDLEKKINANKKEKSDSQQKSAVSLPQKQYIPRMRASDTEAASNCASYWIQQRISQCQTAEGKCIGIPELIPGRCIIVQGINKTYNSKKLWIDHVHHKINEEGFVTEFFVKGWS